MTTTTFPALNTDYDLSDEAVAAYRRDGHTLVRGLVPAADMPACRELITTATMALNENSVPLAERSTYGKAFLQIGNLWERRPETRPYVLARRFAGVAAKLMGCERVRLYHDQALYKEAKGGFTPWHQDQHYWPLDTMTTVTMWMPLVDIDEEMGMLRFASGSQQDGYLGDRPISDDSEREFREYVDRKGYRVEGPSFMAAGDATFHSGWTLHSAPGNNSDTMREVMTIIYYPDGTRVMEPDNGNRANDLKRWLPGCKPGDLAVSELTPLVYP